MTAETSRDGAGRAESGGGGRFARAVLLSPVLWAGLATAGFYALIPQLPVQRELAERYFCGHPIAYATMAAFVLGVATLVLKGLRISIERSAFADASLGGLEVSTDLDPLARAAQLDARLRALPPRMQGTYLIERMRDICTYIRDRSSTRGLEGHLKYLAELGSERLHQSYASVRTITWAVPILGFLGTVVGITLAIANLNFEQLESSMKGVIAGIAVAFDTTTLALALSMVLVFFSFVVERAEQRILNDVEDFGIKRLTCLFPSDRDATSPLVEAEAQAARQLLEKTESLITWQTDLWRDSLESLRGRWAETLQTQTHNFDAALRQGMQATLADHSEQLVRTRGEFLQAFREASRELKDGLAESRAVHGETQEAFARRMDDLWQRVEADITTLREDQTTRIEQMTRTVSERVAAWQAQLKQATEAGTEQLGELRRQREVLLQVAAQEEQLARLQARLAESLEAVRATETFEETLHSLSAAVHLLTARTRPQAA